MRLLRKLVIKLITMVVTVVLMGALLRLAKPYIMKSAGVPEGMPAVEGVAAPKFSADESDLMATFFKSAVRLFTGQAKREELASELSNKLYAGRGGSAVMSELGIELEKPGAKPTDPVGPAKQAASSSSPVGTIVAAGPESPVRFFLAAVGPPRVRRGRALQKRAATLSLSQFMQIELLKSKIHRAAVTGASLHYEGSLTVSSDIAEMVGLLAYEKILVGNLQNGERFETYVIYGMAGMGLIELNGATARLGAIGDRLTIMSFARMTREEAKSHHPRVVVLDEENRVIRCEEATKKVGRSERAMAVAGE